MKKDIALHQINEVLSMPKVGVLDFENAARVASAGLITIERIAGMHSPYSRIANHLVTGKEIRVSRPIAENMLGVLQTLKHDIELGTFDPDDVVKRLQ